MRGDMQAFEYVVQTFCLHSPKLHFYLVLYFTPTFYSGHHHLHQKWHKATPRKINLKASSSLNILSCPV